MSNRIDIELMESRIRLWREGDISDEDLALEMDYMVPELKRCYEEMDRVAQMVADFSNRCEQAEYTDVGEVWGLLDALMKNLASEKEGD